MFSHKKICKLPMVACLGLFTTISTQAMGMASAELYNTKANLYGRFEARIRQAPGDGVISSFFLWKEGSEKDNAYWNELDFEKVGADCHLQTNSIYGNPEKNHEQNNPVSGNLCNEYHEYRFEWTPTYIAWVVDGKEVRRDTGDAASAYSQNATAGMTFHFNIWPGTQDFGGNINNTTLPVREYISWAQYSSYDNGTFELQWREDFQNSTLPEGWELGDWDSPMGKSTHNPANAGIVDGIAILALTADNATGTLGTPPADPAAGGSGGNGGTSGSSSSRSSSSSGGGSVAGGTSSAGGTTASGGHGGTGAGASGGTGTGQSGTSSSGGSAIGGASTSGAGQSSSSASSGGATSSGGVSDSRSSSSSGGANGGSSSLASSAQGGAVSSSASKSSGSSGGSSSSGGNGSSGSSSATSSTATADSSSSGCSCRLGPTDHSAPPILIMSLSVLALLTRIRRKGV